MTGLVFYYFESSFFGEAQMAIYRIHTCHLRSRRLSSECHSPSSWLDENAMLNWESWSIRSISSKARKGTYYFRDQVSIGDSNGVKSFKINHRVRSSSRLENLAFLALVKWVNCKAFFLVEWSWSILDISISLLLVSLKMHEFSFSRFCNSVLIAPVRWSFFVPITSSCFDFFA